jgi:hypothetical protein
VLELQDQKPPQINPIDFDLMPYTPLTGSVALLYARTMRHSQRRNIFGAGSRSWLDRNRYGRKNGGKLESQILIRFRLIGGSLAARDEVGGRERRVGRGHGVVGRDRGQETDEQFLTFLPLATAVGKRGELTRGQPPKLRFCNAQIIEGMTPQVEPELRAG